MNNKLSKASIFKANDIRGIYGRELKNYDAKKIGSVFAEFTKSNEIIVGRDNRISSPALYKSIVRGITDVGSSVIDIGVIDSPGTYFASHLMKKPCIMITASHNPAQHNGFYLCKKDGESIFIHNGLKEIEKNFAKGKIRYSRQKGKVIKKNIWNDYIKHIMSFINKSKIKDMKIVIDPGNGVGAIIAEKIYNQIPQIKVSKINFYQDGRFPNRSPDTSVPKNLKDLCDAVKKEFADFGFAFDGDADRIAFVNEKGIVIEGSIIGALLIDNIFKENIKNEKIIYSIGCSKIVEEIIKKRGAKPIREKVGHSFINASMRKYNALFGVEHTGHYFYRENFFTESAI
jgi:Phosphomannomutase